MTQYGKPSVLPAWAETGDKTQPTNPEIQTGWPLSTTPPSRQRFNWILNWAANAVRYFMQNGISDWDAAEDYPLNARVRFNGVVYRAIVGTSNTNFSPATNPTYWKNESTSWYGDDSGAVNSYVVNPSLPPNAYFDGMVVSFSTTNANTSTTPTLNVNNLGAVSLTLPGGAVVSVGSIPANTVITAIYNTTGPRFELQGVTAQTANAGPGNTQFSHRNKIINAMMSIDQRNAGAVQTIPAGAALAYTVDRWWAACTGANITSQQVAGSAGWGKNQLKFTGLAGNTGFQFGQRIEAANCFDLAGQTATLALDLVSTSLTTLTWTAYYANTADTFGTLASPTKTQIATGTFGISSSLVRYNAQISIPSAAVTGIEIVFSTGALLASQTLTIGRVQLEAGAVATPFENRPYGYELALCQRYALAVIGSFSGFTNGTSSVDASMTFPVVMRASPTAGASLASVAACVTAGGATSTQSALSFALTPTGVSSPWGATVRFANFTGLTSGQAAYVYTSAGTPAGFLTAEL